MSSNPPRSPDSVASVPVPAAAPVSPPAPGLRTRAIGENPPLAARAIELLMGFRAFVRLDAADATTVAAYLREVSYAAGEVLFRAGDSMALSHMLLLLDGEVSVDTGTAVEGQEVPIAVLGPGAVLGEMALLDGAPRSATVTAVTPVQAAGLARRGLERLIDEHPKVAARLMVVLAQHMAERLRALDDQLRMYGQIHVALRPPP
jgi:CRP/FNR family transcriptional regulator, cyclic AMP receptor protein